MESDQQQPRKGEIEHECPLCGGGYYENCLREHEEHLIALVKAWILFLAGTCMTLTVHGVMAYQAYEVAHGRAGLGINLNEMVIAAGALVAAILYWAFPKGGK